MRPSTANQGPNSLRETIRGALACGARALGLACLRFRSSRRAKRLPSPRNRDQRNLARFTTAVGEFLKKPAGLRLRSDIPSPLPTAEPAESTGSPGLFGDSRGTGGLRGGRGGGTFVHKTGCINRRHRALPHLQKIALVTAAEASRLERRDLMRRTSTGTNRQPRDQNRRNPPAGKPLHPADRREINHGLKPCEGIATALPVKFDGRTSPIRKNAHSP